MSDFRTLPDLLPFLKRSTIYWLVSLITSPCHILKGFSALTLPQYLFGADSSITTGNGSIAGGVSCAKDVQKQPKKNKTKEIKVDFIFPPFLKYKL